MDFSNNLDKKFQLYQVLSVYLIKNLTNFGLFSNNKTLIGTIDFYNKRKVPPPGKFGFHKDTLGYTDFVTLSYITRNKLLGPELTICPTNISNTKSIYDLVKTKSIHAIKDTCQILFRPVMNPGYTIGFSDQIFAHSSPSYLHTTDTKYDKNEVFECDVFQQQGVEPQNIKCRLPSSNINRKIHNYEIGAKNIDIINERNFIRTWWGIWERLKDEEIKQKFPIDYYYEISYPYQENQYKINDVTEMVVSSNTELQNELNEITRKTTIEIA